MIYLDTKTFMQKIFNNDVINFRGIKTGSRPINFNGLYNKYMEDKLTQLNNQKYDIYFVVNSGGTKQAQINKINAVFIDFDCGRDKNKRYYPLDVVDRFKKDKLKIINEFKYKPSNIIETRNGLHIYWLVEPDATIKQYEECQLRLIQYFDSDKAVKTLERIMRLPNFWWSKKGYDKFMSKIILNNDVKYYIKDIINSLPEVYIEPKTKKTHTKLKSTKATKTPQKSNIECIQSLDVEGLKACLRKGGIIEECNKYSSIIPPKTPQHSNVDSTTITRDIFDLPKIIVTNRNQMYQAIGEINLIDFLGLSNDKFNCIMHEDNNPSAGIFIGNDGRYIYKCFSGSCGFVGGIVRIVERLAKCNKPRAINFIKAVYNVELIESDWQKEQKEILQTNIDYLLNDQMAAEYPELYKRIKNYIPILVCLHNIAMNNVKDQNLTDSKDIVFFSSFNNILKEMKSNNRNISDRINLFAFLELINKLDEKDIPEYLLNKAKHEAAKKKQRYLVSYYSLPSYNDQQLNTAEDLAKLFKEKNMTMKGWSRELLLRTFGQQMADKVYPQFKQVKISESSFKFEKDFVNVLFKLLDKQGYATEKQCLALLKGYKELNHTKIKRILQDILDKYNLQRLRANKIIKEQYKITGTGYPFIIVR